MTVTAVLAGIGFPILSMILKRRFDNDSEAWEKIFFQGFGALAAGAVAYWCATSVENGSEEVIVYLGAFASAGAAGYMGISCATLLEEQLIKEREKK